jgi:hypothetical protein
VARQPLIECGNPSPPQGNVGLLVAKTLPQFNRFSGPSEPGRADFLGFWAAEGDQPSRDRLAITLNGDGLEPGGVTGDQRQGRFRQAESLAQEGDHRRIGLALVAHGSDPEAEDGTAVIAGFDALDAVGTGIGRDAEVKRQPGSCDAPGGQ